MEEPPLQQIVAETLVEVAGEPDLPAAEEESLPLPEEAGPSRFPAEIWSSEDPSISSSSEDEDSPDLPGEGIWRNKRGAAAGKLPGSHVGEP